MIFNEGIRKVPVRFYQDKYGTIIYESDFTQGVANSLQDAFDEFKRKDFARDLSYYYDDVVEVKIGKFIPFIQDKKYKGMKYLGKLDIEVYLVTDSFFKNSKRSLNYLSKHKNEIPNHLKWIKDMKKLELKEMFEPEKISQDLICQYCGSVIPKSCYYERYRGQAYHIECLWDKIINKKQQGLYEDAKEFFLSLQRYIGDWPAYGYDTESTYTTDLILVKHNLRRLDF